MSYYYTYYIGYKTTDNKIYPLGPYDNKGNLRHTLSRSSSFASDLHEDFYLVQEEQFSDELRKEFSYHPGGIEDQVELLRIKYLPVSQLPCGTFVKRGYFLIEDIKTYLHGDDTWDLFYDRMTPEEYAMRLNNEKIFGPPKAQTDCEGEEIETHSCADYAYFAYEDRNCKEYEAWILRNAVDGFEYISALPKGAELVILEMEG